MVGNIQDHIGSLNWGYRQALADKGVKYMNGLATFTDPHTLKVSFTFRERERERERDVCMCFMLTCVMLACVDMC